MKRASVAAVALASLFVLSACNDKTVCKVDGRMAFTSSEDKTSLQLMVSSGGKNRTVFNTQGVLSEEQVTEAARAYCVQGRVPDLTTMSFD